MTTNHIFITGPELSGKTALAATYANAMRDAGEPTRFVCSSGERALVLRRKFGLRCAIAQATELGLLGWVARRIVVDDADRIEPWLVPLIKRRAETSPHATILWVTTDEFADRVREMVLGSAGGAKGNPDDDMGMTPERFRKLVPGDIIRHVHSPDAVVVTANHGGRVTAVRTVDVTNPREWIVAVPRPSRADVILNLLHKAKERAATASPASAIIAPGEASRHPSGDVMVAVGGHTISLDAFPSVKRSIEGGTGKPGNT